MTVEANYIQEGESLDFTPATAMVPGQVVQLPDGRAGVVNDAIAAAAKGSVSVCGVYEIAKTTSMVILDGGRVYWDYSANAAYFKKVDDRDFYVGIAIGDAAATATTMRVAFNVAPVYVSDLARDTYLTVPVGTQALGGFLPPQRNGGSLTLNITATSEAQKVDALALAGFATGANAIIEGAFRIPTAGSGSASDYNLGIATGTHATDADSITNYLFIHLDGASTNINAQSKDGTTTVASTDTTTDFVAGGALTNRVEFWMDTRDPTDVQIYVEGVLVLASTVFAIAAGTNTWYLLAHLEKTTGTETAVMAVDFLRARIQE